MPLAHTLPLHGWQLIEASAGTGKTWTLSGLYLRLLAEREFSVDQILVMTFTRAATAELRERLRDGIANLLRSLVASDVSEVVDDGFCAPWLAQQNFAPGSARAFALAQRLAQALRDFDQAQIFTLHGFCQRALEGAAFSGALPFERELVNDPNALVQSVVTDFWRREVAQHDDIYFVRALHQHYRSPADLARMLQRWLARGNTQVRGGEAEKALKQSWSDPYLKSWQALRQRVQQTHTQIPEAVAAAKRAGVLPTNKYKSNDLPKWIQQLQDFTAADNPPEVLLFGNKKERDDARKVLARFSPAALGEFAGALGQIIDDFLNTAEQFSAHLQRQVQAFTRRAWEVAREQVNARLRASGEQTFDGLISDLHQALHNTNGERLAHSLRHRLPVALIDECQDTDPLQFEILRAIYRDAEPGCVVLVGDPKQAIYQFRGADLFAYLNMRTHIPALQQHSLTQNQRSVPALLQAWNALLATAEPAFQRADLPYPLATAAPRSKVVPDLQLPTDYAACEVLWLENEGAPLSKTQAQQDLAQAAANEIALWLNRAYALPAHIAVLVNTHQQGETMRVALAQHGVRAALRSRNSVYQSAEAPLLALALHAVLYPQRSAQLRAALLSDWWRLSLAEMAQPETLAVYAQQLVRWQEVWRTQGVLAVVHGLLRQSKIGNPISDVTAGNERRLTNFLHLAELLSQQESAAPGTQAGSPAAVLQFLQRAIKETAEKGSHNGAATEDAQLRLESDAALVQIVTVHASKGLEWPVVFLPFALLSSEATPQAPVLVHEQHQAVLDFAPNNAALQAAQQEAFEEKLRSAYVALTRASHYCVLSAAAVKDADISPLGYWLKQGLSAETSTPASEASARESNSLESNSYESSSSELNTPTSNSFEISTALQAWIARAAGSVRMRSAEREQHYYSASNVRNAEVENETTLLHPSAVQASGWQLTSFTALTANAEPEQDEDEVEIDTLTASVPAPNFSFEDALQDQYQEEYEQQEYQDEYREQHPNVSENFVEAASSAESLTTLEKMPLRFRFERGALAGIQLHHYFETLDWSAPAESWQFNTKRGTEREPELRVWFDEIRNTPLPPLLENSAPWSLRQVSKTNTQREMNFFMPLQHAQLQRLAEVAAPYGYALPRFQQTVQNGFLKGSVDLVCWQQGRAYLVDYKSNWLGDSFAAYAPAALEGAMREHGYHAQHLLYLTALHRWLSRAMPGYQYNTHIGGVVYLFVRGMTPQQPGCGVYATRPARELIEAISQLLTPNSSALDEVSA